MANTTLLLHFNGANGSSDFVDSGSLQTALINYGTYPYQVTNTYAFSTASGYFGGAGYFKTEAFSEFNMSTDDWTIEFWMKSTANTGSWNGIVGTNRDTDVAGVWTIGNRSGGNNQVSLSQYNGSTWKDISIPSAYNPNDDSWHHIAFSRTGDTIKGFFDGYLRVTDTGNAARTFGLAGRVLQIGMGYSPLYYTGYLDELRITHGVGLYDTDFTPTGPFSDPSPAPSTTNTRITSEVLEVLGVPVANVRVSSEVLEVIGVPASNVRVSSIVLEVLRIAADPPALGPFANASIFRIRKGFDDEGSLTTGTYANVSGNVVVGGQLTSGIANLASNVSIGGSIAVVNAVTFSNTGSFGNTTSGSVTIANTARVGGNLASNTAVLGGTLTVAGLATTAANVNIAGDSPISGSSNIAGGLTVQGNVIFAGTTSVPTAANGTSNSTIASTQFVQNSLMGNWEHLCTGTRAEDGTLTYNVSSTVLYSNTNATNLGFTWHNTANDATMPWRSFKLIVKKIVSANVGYGGLVKLVFGDATGTTISSSNSDYNAISLDSSSDTYIMVLNDTKLSLNYNFSTVISGELNFSLTGSNTSIAQYHYTGSGEKYFAESFIGIGFDENVGRFFTTGKGIRSFRLYDSANAWKSGTFELYGLRSPIS